MADPAEKPAHMTDIEWAGLNSEDSGPSPDEAGPVVDEVDVEKTPEELAAEQALADAETLRLQQEADAKKLAEQQPAAAPLPPPILDVPAVEDAPAKLAEITTKKDALATLFDDGELAAKDYQTQLDALNREERDIERAVERSEIAGTMRAQQARNQFLADVDDFTKDTPYKQSAAAWSALDAAVKMIGQQPESAGLTGKQILAKAHAEVMKDPVFSVAFAKTPAKTPTGGKPATDNLPPNLGRMPAAEINDTDGNRFAALERLRDTNPLEYEKQVGKLSAADLDTFLKQA